MKIMCDKCQHQFDLESKNIMKIEIQDIEIQYFICEECKDIFIVSCINDYMKMQQIRYKKYKEAGNNDKALKCLNHMKTHNDRLKRKVLKELRIIYA